MEKVREALLKISKQNLINALINAEYAFAQWRMPGTQKEVLIVSLNGPVKTKPEVSNLATGFLVNKFADNHPSKPYLIKADLIFENDTLRIDPRISDDQLESFEKALKKSHTKAKPLVEIPKLDSAGFRSIVSEAVDQIKKGLLDKVVLSRYKDILLPQDFSVDRFFKQISGKYANAFCNLFFLPNEGLWVGATPELLLSDQDNLFKTHALAGTKALSDRQDLSDIAWTQKEIEEQAMVSRYIIDCFKKIRLREFKEVGPRTVRAGNLAHLKTTYEVDHTRLGFENLAEQMLELLHPTSAVCGMPHTTATQLIRKLENFDRSFFSGYIGPVNFHESTHLFVNLRCMRIDGSMARLFAGAGITADSDPEKEWRETEMKMGTLSGLLF